MANWSYCEISLSGTTDDILFAETELNKNITDDWLDTSKHMKGGSLDQQAGYSGAEVVDYRVEDTSISLSLNGRWCAPHLYIIELAKRHALSGTYADSEQGCNFFHEMVFSEGELVSNEESEYFSQESINHHGLNYFLEEYQFIAEEDDWEENNEELIKLFAKNGCSVEDLRKEWT